MVDLAPGWTMEMERGPDWLIVRLHPRERDAAADEQIADRLWELLEQHFTYRLVLEMHDLPVLHSAMLGELATLYRRIQQRGGVMRICGLSENCQEALRASQLDGCFAPYRNREEAVRGHRPHQPR